jgi:hypothetical protein
MLTIVMEVRICRSGLSPPNTPLSPPHPHAGGCIPPTTPHTPRGVPPPHHQRTVTPPYTGWWGTEIDRRGTVWAPWGHRGWTVEHRDGTVRDQQEPPGHRWGADRAPRRAIDWGYVFELWCCGPWCGCEEPTSPPTTPLPVPARLQPVYFFALPTHRLRCRGPSVVLKEGAQVRPPAHP